MTMTMPITGQAGLERVRFFPGQILTADDMSLSTEWVLEKLRRHNRYLHGWGIVCGCDVKPPGGTDSAWTVHICPGYLITPQGDEVLIASEAKFDLAGCILSSADPCATARPCPPITRRPAGTTQKVYLAVRYVECDARPVRIAPAGCSCGDGQCDYSRVREAYEFCCLDSLPPVPPPYGCDHLCHGDVLACPDCPPERWVVLATVTLPSSVDTTLIVDNISPADRRLLYSAAMLREMAICNCGPQPAPQPPAPQPPMQTVEPPVIEPPTGIYAAAITVTITDATPQAQIYYTTSGDDPTPGGPTTNLYGAPFPLWTQFASTVTVKAKATKANFNDSPIRSVDYTFTGVIQ